MSDSIISVISDLAILVLPLPLTWSLQMPRKKKIRVIGLLGAGGLATAFSVYRLALIIHNGQSQDATVVLIKVILSGYVPHSSQPPPISSLTNLPPATSNAEAGIGLICACLPATSALYTHYTHAATSSRLHEQPSNSHSQSQSAHLRMTHMSGRRDKIDNLYTDLEIGSGDQAVLVSNAAHEETGRAAESDAHGIMKTVGVHYAVTYTQDGKIAPAREQPPPSSGMGKQGGGKMG